MLYALPCLDAHPSIVLCLYCSRFASIPPSPHLAPTLDYQSVAQADVTVTLCFPCQTTILASPLPASGSSAPFCRLYIYVRVCLCIYIVTRQGESKDGLIRGGLGFEGALMDGREVGEEEESRAERRGRIIHLPALPTIWLVGCGKSGSPPFPPPTPLSLFFYLLPAITPKPPSLFFFLLQYYYFIVPCHFLFAHGVGHGYQVLKQEEGCCWLLVLGLLLVAPVGGRSGPTGRVLPCGFLAVLSHVRRGLLWAVCGGLLLLNVGDRTEADAVRPRPPPGGESWGGGAQLSSHPDVGTFTG